MWMGLFNKNMRIAFKELNLDYIYISGAEFNKNRSDILSNGTHKECKCARSGLRINQISSGPI